MDRKRDYFIFDYPVSERDFSIDNPYLEEIGKLKSKLNWKDIADLSALLEWRADLVTKYAFSVPVAEVLETVAGYSPIVEIGAGTGYWAMCLSQLGAHIDAFDIKPPDENFPCEWNDTNYWFGDTWYSVWEGDESIAGAYPERTLFLSWPMPEDPMAYNALHHYRKAGGHTVIYIGDRRSSGDEAFHNEIESSQIIESRRLWSWPGIEERLVIFAC